MDKVLKGKVWKFPDDVDTDMIVPGRYLVLTGEEELAACVMEGHDPDFAKKVGKGDIIVAGKNFGCGSSREHAPIAIKGAGISAVVAESFARIFYRNSINIGLLLIEAKGISKHIGEGDEIEIDIDLGVIKDVNRSKEFEIKPLPEFMMGIMNEGGLISYLKNHLAEIKD
ncbi:MULTISPECIES: 3-isopropylmalate dehydratase small subunit [Methanobacterium]|jgi:3-isopropylmalate/(R)-2-methylmalate dehydratase small subunit|uniref:3-isopropylmalate dehydratase small subunit n=1 Tax=Methanobacterium subterraneum TaxID=59277 RepID=A0A2H4VRS0_9EURY|nr:MULTISPECIES: 3-isopropylmalate dehydratase small subunit [Methanobacterium]MBW4256234.1 3-isopropylmalate dehydratase small subunit [Methanobacterium sp. YSL]PKL73475.1 MAG: 3-isopropylmalate dehydratase [Methanobacteriales archaeon HGW-Methanobacteriales-2]AUB55353.1 3-isopropylmalate dehydratase [Methanobacterium subterraneum]AUB57670.1 3-isopropylmalate dehydratase [Methanobacterium sp. MZ-A1]AUB60803.1 3-isopropylmalate dehydratase [Methanobacterium subterraneum]